MHSSSVLRFRQEQATAIWCAVCFRVDEGIDPYGVQFDVSAYQPVMYIFVPTGI